LPFQRPPPPTLLPYTTLFRSHHVHAHTLEAFARSVALRDEGTGGHCERVALNAYTMGEALGLDPHELRDLYWAGLLHDLGKIAIDRKSTRLNSSHVKISYAVF